MVAEFLAVWWWIDRWRKSTAYTDMTLAEQGAYRNLIDELWLRGGAVPDEDRILAKVSGAGMDWPKVRGAVLARFYLTPEGWRNETHDEVAAQSRDRQGRFRLLGRAGGRARASTAERDSGGKFTSTAGPTASSVAGEQPSRGTKPPTPSPDQTPEPDPSPEEGCPSPEELRQEWNKTARRHGLAKVQILSKERRRLLVAFGKEAGSLEVAAGAFEAAASTYAGMSNGRNFGLFNLSRPANRQKWITAAAEAGPAPWSPGKEEVGHE